MQNRITRKRNGAILRKVKFENDCAKYFSFKKKCSTDKAKTCAFLLKCAIFGKWKPYLKFVYLAAKEN